MESPLDFSVHCKVHISTLHSELKIKPSFNQFDFIAALRETMREKTVPPTKIKRIINPLHKIVTNINGINPINSPVSRKVIIHIRKHSVACLASHGSHFEKTRPPYSTHSSAPDCTLADL